MATRPKDEANTKGANGAASDGAPDADRQQAALDEDLHRYIAPVVGPDDERVITDSGIEIKRLYEEDDVKPGLQERLGEPGEYPFTRGIHPGMYRDRLWTMRQYAGFASPEDTNERYRYLTEHGSTGLSMAFDLPTQLGRDSDDPLCEGEVGRTGVPIDTIEDMRICFDQISLAEVSTSMTINAPAAILLLLYELVGEEQGVPSDQLRGTVQNDVLKEYVSRGNYIYPPEPTMRLTTDIFAYCDENVPKWNTISISGYHMREKGCSAVQEVAFTLANAIAYVEAGINAGLDVNKFGQRLAFFFNGHNNVFQEIAKFRAVRRMWAKIMRDRFGATDEKAQMIRFHTQTGGVTLQAQQPEVNIIRVALQGFAAVAGGTQSLHTNGFDEALALPTERSARIALRTQQVLAHESGVADTVDPFAGSYFIESLTDEVEERSWELMKKVEDLGGSVNALEFIQKEIEESAISYQERYRTGQDIIVGVNKYVTDVVDDVDILKVDPESEKRQLARLAKWKENRDQADGRQAPRRAPRRRPGRRQPAAADQGGAARRRLDRRRLQRDARRLRRVPRRRLLLIGASGHRPGPMTVLDRYLHNDRLRLVDVGARGGIASRWDRFLSVLDVTAFEPDSAECERLNRDAASLPYPIRYLPVALGRESDDAVPFHVTRGWVLQGLRRTSWRRGARLEPSASGLGGQIVSVGRALFERRADWSGGAPCPRAEAVGDPLGVPAERRGAGAPADRAPHSRRTEHRGDRRAQATACSAH